MFSIVKSTLKSTTTVPWTSQIRLDSHGYPGGIPGKNLPFKLYRGRIGLTIRFIIFFGSGLYAPFWVLKHQLEKK